MTVFPQSAQSAQSAFHDCANQRERPRSLCAVATPFRGGGLRTAQGFLGGQVSSLPQSDFAAVRKRECGPNDMTTQPRKERQMTTRTQSRDDLKAMCDDLFSTAIRASAELGAPPGMALDRAFTTLAVYAITGNGKEPTAAAFEQMATNIRAGMFDGLFPGKRQQN